MTKQPSAPSVVDTILYHKYRFFAGFFVVFTLTYGTLALLDVLPESPSGSPEDERVEPASEETRSGEQVPQATSSTEQGVAVEEGATDPAPIATAALPESIHIDPLERTLPVNNPTSRTIADLDKALLTGVVRHPDSATLTQDGTVFILGHSSYLPSVRNRYFQAFNGIQDLQWGDTIRVRTADAEHVYRVDRVYHARAAEVTVPIANTGPKLILATCNSFGSVDDRFVVEASRIEVRTLAEEELAAR